MLSSVARSLRRSHSPALHSCVCRFASRPIFEDAAKCISEVKGAAKAKFDETVEIVITLNVDPRRADELVRGVVALPHGTGKVVRVAVFAKDEKAEEARQAGATLVGAEELVKSIQNGELNFDTCIATPDMMSQVGKVARILGPRGMMPNPKMGTVTNEVAAMVKQIQAGRLQFRVDKTGNVHAPVGKVSFSEEALLDNVQALCQQVVQLKPPAIKSKYIKSAAMSSTMGPGMHLTPAAIEKIGAPSM